MFVVVSVWRLVKLPGLYQLIFAVKATRAMAKYAIWYFMILSPSCPGRAASTRSIMAFPGLKLG